MALQINDTSGICILIPTYNNAGTLRGVLEDVLEFGIPVIVVNDGSTDNTSGILDDLSARIDLIQFERNKGKGAALRAGIKRAANEGFQHCITMDSDGQHLAKDLPQMINTLKQYPKALIMGSRDLDAEGAPGKSSFGNKFSNFWFWVETGQKLPDTQTGFRVYPMDPVGKMRFFTTKFEFEIEVLVRSVWRGAQVNAVPVRSIYDMEERISHFRPLKDFTRISLLNTVLVLCAVFWYHPWRLYLYIKRKGIWNVVKSDLLDTNEPIGRKAAAVGFGLFMGIIPIWGFQMIVAAALAIPLRLNKFIVLVFSNISIPPMIPLIIYGSYLMGGFLVEDPRIFPSWEQLTLEAIYIDIKQYLIGSVLLAFSAGVVGFASTYLTLSIIRAIGRRK